MMPALKEPERLVERLPRVRGRLTEDAPLAPITWFRVGGPAEVLFRPADREDLAHFLAGCPADVPITVMGVASNLLVRDGGVPGVVIRLARGFNNLDIEGERVTVGAAVLDLNVALACAQLEVAGLEFLSGIPGTIGGALRMNAGAYGREIKDVIEHADLLDRDGNLHRLSAAELGLGYRHSSAPPDWIFVGATLRGEPGEEPTIAARIAEIQKARADSQPIRSRTGGSTFANPPGARAWQLIDNAGCRGLKHGGAQVSDMHCNFLINTGDASAADLEFLGETVRRRVLETSGVSLDWEIKRVGVPMAANAEGE